MSERYAILRLYYAKCHDSYMHEGQIINPKSQIHKKIEMIVLDMERL